MHNPTLAIAAGLAIDSTILLAIRLHPSAGNESEGGEASCG